MKIYRMVPLLALTIWLVIGVSPAYATDETVNVQSSDQAEEELGQRATVRYANELFHTASDPIGGNPQGKITLVEFFDFRCGHCIRMFSVLQDLIHRYPELKIVYKNYPVLGPESDYAAHAALAANLQGKYLVFQAALIGSPITVNNVLALARASGLDIPKLKAEMESERIERELHAISRLADNIGLGGTPAFFIAKSNISSQTPPSEVAFFPGEVEMEDLEQAINRINQ